MIKLVFLFLFCVQLVQIKSEPVPDTDDTIVRYINQPYNGVDGGYSFEYETSDRQIRQEEGVFGKTADGELVLRVTGYYRYLGTDGKNRLIEYESDENGYRQTVTILMKPSRNRINPNALKSLIG